MIRPLGEHLLHDSERAHRCARKRAYPSAFAAEKALKHLSFTYRYRAPTLQVYQCEDCGKWYLGRTDADRV